jgi:hypothetical protein
LVADLPAGEAMREPVFRPWVITFCKFEPTPPPDDLHRFLIEAILYLFDYKVFAGTSYTYYVRFR